MKKYIYYSSCLSILLGASMNLVHLKFGQYILISGVSLAFISLVIHFGIKSDK
jgi:hypothetical protein